MWFKKKPKYDENGDLLKIANILFPPLEKRRDNEGNVYQVDSSADTNLEAALYDLTDGNNDPVVRGTISKVITRLIEARKVLHSYPALDKETKYIIVQDEMPETKIPE